MYLLRIWRRRILCVSLLGLITIIVILYLKNIRIHDLSLEPQRLEIIPSANGGQKIIDEIFIAVVACGTRYDETLNMIKSAIMFNVHETPLTFIIIAEEDLHQGFKEKLDDWREATRNKFTFVIHNLTFPEKNAEEWKNLFKPCAAQRLFLPSVLHDIDAVLYVDTDVLFISAIDEIWRKFHQFNSSQMAALAPEHEDKNVGWYNRFARHPYYGPLGVNSGVMLMNLTRMRKFKWVDYMLPLYKEYKLKIPWGDQDLINILFYYHPDKLFVYPCEWNYRPDHCMYMSVCPAPDGIKIIHGNRAYFHRTTQPVFSTLYKTVQEFQLGKNLYYNFLTPLEAALADSQINSTCGKVVDKFLHNPRRLFNQTDYYYNR